jgi:signal transduction histidine kinase
VSDAIARFRRADAARSTPGSGLGLAVVHTIVSVAGGELRACTAGRHYTYRPERFGAISCRHYDQGFTATALLPSGARVPVPGELDVGGDECFPSV